MGCACSSKGGRVKPMSQGFLRGQAETTSFDYENPLHSRNIEIIHPRLRFAKTFADRISRKLVEEGFSPESEASTGTSYMLPEHFPPFKPEKIVLNLNRVKHVKEGSHPAAAGETESLCSGSLTNAARNFYVRDSIS